MEESKENCSKQLPLLLLTTLDQTGEHSLYLASVQSRTSLHFTHLLTRQFKQIVLSPYSQTCYAIDSLDSEIWQITPNTSSCKRLNCMRMSKSTALKIWVKQTSTTHDNHEEMLVVHT